MKIITTNKGIVYKICDCHWDLVKDYGWHSNAYGYAVRSVQIGRGLANRKKKTIWMHRYILGDPQNRVVDHKDTDNTNNQCYNLRICKQAENSRNRPKGSNNTSGYKGVSLRPYGRWRAYICIEYKYVHIGEFATPEEAALAYNEAAIKYHGQFARLNQISIDKLK